MPVLRRHHRPHTIHDSHQHSSHRYPFMDQVDSDHCLTVAIFLHSLVQHLHISFTLSLHSRIMNVILCVRKRQALGFDSIGHHAFYAKPRNFLIVPFPPVPRRSDDTSRSDHRLPALHTSFSFMRLPVTLHGEEAHTHRR